jgi:hypothetical protein
VSENSVLRTRERKRKEEIKEEEEDVAENCTMRSFIFYQ